jgi:alkylation response protein AidB-like acyl-CoA dehydrogenase
LAAKRFVPHRCSWSTYDAEFSCRAGAEGFIGVTLPTHYGGRGLSSLVRFVITAEFLAAGAPLFAHWIADRQSGPQILRHGSEEAKRTILPQIAKGTCCFGIGMSEPNSGSDLAAVRTRGKRVNSGWLINGSKIWTSNAHRADYLLALIRTGDPGDSRHEGLTQFIINLSDPGLTVRPIHNIAGEHEFNEVFFSDYFVADSMVVGREGDGWSMVTSELAFERSGPDRFLSDYQLLVELVARVSGAPTASQLTEIGRLVSHLAALFQMSASIAASLDAGKSPTFEAALVKDVGTTFEQELPEAVRRVVHVEPHFDDADRLADAMAHVTLAAPSFTIRGGTREILRGVIARGLGVR